MFAGVVMVAVDAEEGLEGVDPETLDSEMTCAIDPLHALLSSKPLRHEAN